MFPKNVQTLTALLQTTHIPNICEYTFCVDLLQTEERINIKSPSSNFVGEFSHIILLQKAHDIDVWSD